MCGERKKGWNKDKVFLPHCSMCMCACVFCMCICVGACSQNCSRSQCECDLDPGLLLKSAGLQAKHCVSHQTQSHTQTHTHTSEESSIVLLDMLCSNQMWPSVTEPTTCVCVCVRTRLPALLPWGLLVTSTCLSVSIHILVHARVPSGRNFNTDTTCLEVSGIHDFHACDCSASKHTHKNMQICTHTHTYSLYTQALIFISNMQKALNRHPSTHTYKHKQAHTDPRVSLCMFSKVGCWKRIERQQRSWLPLSEPTNSAVFHSWLRKTWKGWFCHFCNFNLKLNSDFWGNSLRY